MKMNISQTLTERKHSFLLWLLIGLLTTTAACYSPEQPPEINPDLPTTNISTLEDEATPTVPHSQDSFSAADGQYTIMGIYPDESLPVYSGPDGNETLSGSIRRGETDILIHQPTLDLMDSDRVRIKWDGIEGWVDFNSLAIQKGELPVELIRLGEEILYGLKQEDYSQITNYLDPEICLRFSPYPYLKEENQIFCPADLQEVFDSNPTLTWGVYDGTGDPILLDFQQYHQKFVFDLDFFHPEIVGYNLEVSSGNSPNNIQDYYPGAVFIEYHFPEVDPQYAGLDWRSLRLVFVEKNSTWVLAAVVHCEWTI
jgi:hypothetical protein